MTESGAPPPESDSYVGWLAYRRCSISGPTQGADNSRPSGHGESDLGPTAQEIPLPGAPWSEVEKFAVSYDAYGVLGGFDAVARLARETRAIWNEKGKLSADVTGLRAALFFEQRRFEHYGTEPDEEALMFINAVLAALAKRVSGGADTAEVTPRPTTRSPVVVSPEEPISTRVVTLVDEDLPSVSVRLRVSVETDRMLMEGHDTGTLVERLWGDSDYEYWLSVDEQHLDTVFAALHALTVEGPSTIPQLRSERDNALLDCLEECWRRGLFETQGEFRDWLNNLGVPSRFSNYT